MEKAPYKENTECRVCAGSLVEYLDLGLLPLANNLCSSTIETAERYPLKVLRCQDCGLSQLGVVINPEILYSYYTYRSSMSQGYKDHCFEMAKSLKTKYGLNDKSFAVDLAGNDGTLLKQFKSVIPGLKVLNIDPAVNLTTISAAIGIPALPYFWGRETAKRVFNGFGKADVITMTNCFAHIDDLYDLMAGIKILLKPTGVFIIEMPYFPDTIKENSFGQIYFEHLSYFTIGPIVRLVEKFGFRVMNVEHFDIHEGSIRVTIGYGNISDSVKKYMEQEWEITDEVYQHFAESVHLVVRELVYKLNELKIAGNKIAAFGASAKGNTLLNCAGIGQGTLNFICDETPEKIGKVSPGSRLPIISLADMMSNPPDYLLILSWNFFSEIADKCRKAGYKGKFIVPIPVFTILD